MESYGGIFVFIFAWKILISGDDLNKYLQLMYVYSSKKENCDVLIENNKLMTLILILLISFSMVLNLKTRVLENKQCVVNKNDKHETNLSENIFETNDK